VLISSGSQHPPGILPELAGHVLVVGLGASGLSCLRLLRRLGVNVAATDTRDRPPALEQVKASWPDLPLFLGGLWPQAFRNADLLLLSPGVALAEPEVAAAAARGVRVWGDIELFARLAQAPTVAITGTNGKSTVTALLGQMAERAGRRVRVGGNLGTPALELLDPQAELYVLELSSFQLETTWSLYARAAAVLNISADHLDRYPSSQAYAAAKARIFQGAGTQVLNLDDPAVLAMALPGRPQIGFTLGKPGRDQLGRLRLAGKRWLAHGARPLLAVTELGISGAHNEANVLAALALSLALGLPLAPCLQAAREFSGLPHRSQLVRERRGVRFVNDSKGTNVGATVAAVAGLEGKLVLIAGGLGKGQDFAPLREALRGRTRAVLVIGKDGPAIARVLASEHPVHAARDLGEAVTLAAELARPGDTVLLSPACASMDMFRDYAERGEAFAAAVAGLPA